MRRMLHIAIALMLLPAAAVILLPAAATAQYNCSIYKDSSYARACRIYNYAGDSLIQGSAKCEHWLDSAIATCPGFAPAWHEKSVPYLKRGDFVTWRRILDKAVDLDPRQFLAYRGWCRFEFLRDYAGAMEDLRRFDTLSEFSHTSSNDGDYELHLVMALCERELGDTGAAFHYFGVAMDADSTNAGLYGWLHLGVTRLGVRDYRGAIAALEHENRVYEQFADTWYWLGRVYLATGQRALAKKMFLHAMELMNDHSGRYHLHGPYCEKLDAIYASDIDAALADL
jgi:tetratricopeptide (TPR) repeat protein